MANPFHDPRLRHAQAKGLAHKIVPEAVDSPMLEPNFAGRSWELLRERLDHVAEQGRANDVGLKRPPPVARGTRARLRSAASA